MEIYLNFSEVFSLFIDSSNIFIMETTVIGGNFIKLLIKTPASQNANDLIQFYYYFILNSFM